MNIEIKKLWIEALKSGNYVQGFKSFNNDEKFCALGVLLDLYIKSIDSNCKEFKKAHTYKAQSIIFDWCKFELCDFKIMAMNDDEKKSFAEIADFIEQNY